MHCTYYYEKKVNRDCQQFHQYKKNKQSPLTSNHWS